MNIDKNIPIPAGRAGYPFAGMEVGDSFLCEAEDTKKKSISVASAARAFGRKHSAKFATRTVEGGVRCWRIE